MTTHKQIEANRRNSLRSAGPKSRTGKAVSKMNAMKHGLLAADLVVGDEDPAEFTRVLKHLVDEFQPQEPLEEQLVERVAACMWRLRRLYRVEAGILTYEALTIELGRARTEARGYEKVEELYELSFQTERQVHITDKKTTWPSQGTGGETGTSSPGKISGPWCRFQERRGKRRRNQQAVSL